MKNEVGIEFEGNAYTGEVTVDDGVVTVGYARDEGDAGGWLAATERRSHHAPSRFQGDNWQERRGTCLRHAA